jgi:NADH-quinone oxidoreductase subunit C/D
MSEAVLDELQRVFPHYIRDSHRHRGDETLVILPQGLIPIVEHLRNRLGFDMLVDICGNDYPEREERFEAIYHFLSFRSQKNRWKRIRLKVPVREGQTIPSLTSHYKSANWYERETWDMYGIVFEGHPALKRILTHWKFVGHPLRKDYEKEHRQYIDTPAPSEWFGIHPHTLEDGSETMVVNIGPSHPFTHGIVRIIAELDGENIIDSEVEIGYLHRCYEKEAEFHTWSQIMPYTDRLNYVSCPTNTVGYSMAVEKLAGIEDRIPERAKWMRMIMAEIGRLMDHCTCIGPSLVDMGALTNYWYLFKIRETCYTVLDRFAGSRLTSTCDRIGGYANDIYDGFYDDIRAIQLVADKNLHDVERLILKNRIFLDRTVGVGRISLQDAISWGLSGPVARASGLECDVRKIAPYNFYDQVDFEMVIGLSGDTHDRLMVRLYEMRESLKIIEQSCKYLKLTNGQPTMADVQDITLPPIEDTYSKMEEMIRHFNIVYRGERVPTGEAYGYTEGANGELGFYLVSRGKGQPQRVHVHPPCFSVLQTLSSTIRGLVVADLVATFSSYNIIAGELDR